VGDAIVWLLSVDVRHDVDPWNISPAGQFKPSTGLKLGLRIDVVLYEEHFGLGRRSVE
jgi:hypothetical protein